MKFKARNAPLLFLVPLLVSGFLVQALAQETTIYMDSTRQVIDGFGAANIVNWRPDMTGQEIEKAFGKDEGELGFSILRLRIPPSQSEWSDYVPTAQVAHEMGVTIIASPWSPPAEMKTNNSTVGGRLSDDMYGEYADHLDSFNTYMADNGVPLYAISVQNEPDIEVSYESCDWTPDEMTRFVREFADSIGTKIIAPESFQFRRPISDAILNDSAAAANLDIVGGHIYGGGLEPYPLAKQKGKKLWMTEHLDTDISWDATLATGKEIHDVMDAGMNAYIWWYIVRFYGPIHDGEDWDEDNITDNTEKSEITKRGYIMSQYSRFIRPGYLKITATENPQNNIFVTAYRDTSDVDTAKTIIVALNMGDSPVEQTFVLENRSTPSFKQYVTNETLNAGQLDEIAVSNNSFTVTLEAESVTTFISDSAAVTSVVNKPEIPGSFHLFQNYPNPFNPATKIRYQIPVSGKVSLQVFDVLGREVTTLVDSYLPAGEYQATFNAENLTSGIYIYRLKVGGFVKTRQMSLIK